MYTHISLLIRNISTKEYNSNSNVYVIILLIIDKKILLAIKVKPCRWAVPHAGLGKS